MAKIFISYSRKDSKAAKKLMGALETIEHEVWVDWESIPPAADWLEQIFRGIESSDAFIFLVSPHSIKSEVCNVEIGRAALNHKRIIPVVVRDVEPDTTNEIIRKLNWTFIRKGESFEEGLAKINTAIELDLDWVEEHNRLQSRALVWHRKKDPSLLLSGRDLRNARDLVLTAGKKDPIPTDLQKTYIHHSYQGERRRKILGVATGLVIIALAILSVVAVANRNQAIMNEALALKNEAEARENEQLAIDREQEALVARAQAEEQRKIAEEQTKVAKAQRSAARAQIYQSQPGELYTSTLLAVDSWETSPTEEAEEILRRNISLLPIPVNQKQQEGGINSLEFNPARELFVTGGVDGNACVWKASDGNLVQCVASSTSVNDAVFSPDGEFLVVGDAAGEVQIIRVADWSVQHTYRSGAVVWNVDVGGEGGKDIAVVRDDGRISIVNLDSGKWNYDLQVSGRVQIAAFSPNGNYIAAGSSTGVVNMWNLETGGNPLTSGTHKGAAVLALVFSPDSRYLITGGADDYAVAARVSTGQELYRVLHEGAVTDIAFNPNDPSWFATVSNDHRIRLWDTFDGDERIRMSQDNFVNSVDISPNGQWLATTGADRTVRVWNASTGAEMFQVPIDSEGRKLGFSGEGNTLVTGDENGNIGVWDISAMPAPESFLQFADLVGDMQFSPSGEWLAASDGTRIWLLKSEQLATLTKGSDDLLNITVTGNISSLVFSPDSNWLGVSTDAGQVLVYDLLRNNWRTLASTGAEHEIVFSADSTSLLVSQPEGRVDRGDLISREPIDVYIIESQNVQSMAISPTQIALGVENEIIIRNMDGEKALSIESPGDHSLLAFNTDGTMLASSNSEGLIEIRRFENGAFSVVGSIRKETIYSLTFNPDGTQLAVGTTNTVYLIDPTTVTETARIPNAGNVVGISYSADGNIMATASRKAVQFWDVTKIQIINSVDLADVACSRLKENFSQSQWNNLFGGETYVKLCDSLPVPE